MTGATAPASVARRLLSTVSNRPQRLVLRGASLYHEGEPSNEAYFVHNGLLKMVKTTGDGTEALIALRGAEGLIGEHSAIDGRPRLTSAVVVFDAAITAMSRLELLDAIHHDGALAVDLLAEFAGHLRLAAEHVLEMTAGDAVALVARRLTELATDPVFESVRAVHGDTVVIEMPMSQQELATWAGVSHRSAADALRRLRDAGSVTTSRLHLEILDLPALTECSVGGATRSA